MKKLILIFLWGNFLALILTACTESNEKGQRSVVEVVENNQVESSDSSSFVNNTLEQSTSYSIAFATEDDFENSNISCDTDRLRQLIYIIENNYFQVCTEDGWDNISPIQGQDGADGVDGTDGQDGVDGQDGLDGADGQDGLDGADGQDGVDGADGQDGVDGADGMDGENAMLISCEDNEIIVYDRGQPTCSKLYVDCGGELNGNLVEDCDGICGGDNFDCEQDCSGTWGGSKILDCDGVCDGSNFDCEKDCLGDYNGDEVIQLYLRDMKSSVTRPVKELIDYRRVNLMPGESKEVVFELNQLSI